MTFRFTPLRIKDVILVTPRVFEDERGYFEETYKETDFKQSNLSMSFVQDNHSFSTAGTLRGLHFQRSPNPQGKLVRCIHGKILDVAVDLRNESPTFGEWVLEILSSENHRMLWIPEGFAHGFFALEDSHVEYKVTREYNKESEDGIIWNDPLLGVEWNIQGKTPIVSHKDSEWPLFDSNHKYFDNGVGGTFD